MSARIRLGNDRPIGFLERNGKLLVLFIGRRKANKNQSDVAFSHLADVWENASHKNQLVTKMLDVESSQLIADQPDSVDFDILDEFDKTIFLDSLETNSTHEMFVLGKTRRGFELYNLMISKAGHFNSFKVSRDVVPTITAKAGSQIDAPSALLECIFLVLDCHSSENPSKTYLYHENPYEDSRRSLVGEIKNSIIITGDRLGRVQFISIMGTHWPQSENVKCDKQVQLTDEPIVAIEAKEIIAMQSKKVFMAVASKMKFSIYEIITDNNQIDLKNIQTALFDSEITSLASVSKNTTILNTNFNIFQNWNDMETEFVVAHKCGSISRLKLYTTEN